MIEENTTEQILTLTPGAIRQLAIIRQEQSIPEDLGLRVGVKVVDVPVLVMSWDLIPIKWAMRLL